MSIIWDRLPLLVRHAWPARGAVSWCVLALLACVTIASRFYRLAAQPLWLDELYSYQVSIQPIARLLRNSLYESNPPLYYVFLKGALAASTVATEYSVRWFSAACGVAAILGVCAITAQLANDRWAVGSWLLLIGSPAVLYFSQEARSYILGLLLATASAFVVVRLLERRNTRAAWASWTLLSGAGFYTAYSYLLIFGMQALFLGWAYRREKRYWLALLIVLVAMLAWAPVVVANIGQDLQRASAANGLSLGVIAQALLAGDPLRYGVRWWSFALPGVLGALAVCGLLAAFTSRQIAQWYVALQVALPLAVFGAATFFLHMRVPLFQSRQFFVLLPAFFILATLGLRWCVRCLPGWLQYTLAGATCVCVATISGAAVQHYWTTAKSPEGQAVQAVQRQYHQGDIAVSLQYSLDAAARFYLAGMSHIYNAPQQSSAGYLFDDNLLILRGQAQRSPHVPLATIRRAPSFWVLNDTRSDAAVRDALIENCTIASKQTFSPFEIFHVVQCR